MRLLFTMLPAAKREAFVLIRHGTASFVDQPRDYCLLALIEN